MTQTISYKPALAADIMDGVKPVDHTDPEALAKHLADMEGALGVWAQKHARMIADAKEARGILDRELAQKRSHALSAGIVKSKAAADVWADEQVFADVGLGTLAAQWLTLDATAYGLKAIVEAIEKRISATQSLLKRHMVADQAHARGGVG